MDSRLRAGRGIGKDETEAGQKAFEMLQQRGHPDGPLPLTSDGLGGIDDAIGGAWGECATVSALGRGCLPELQEAVPRADQSPRPLNLRQPPPAGGTAGSLAPV
jgi:hypothetical protein